MFKKLILAPIIIITTSVGIVTAASIYTGDVKNQDLVLSTNSTESPLSEKEIFFPDVEISAIGGFVGKVDNVSGLIGPLYEKNKNQKLPIASISKLLTAHIITQDKNLLDKFTVTKWAISGPWPSNKFEVGSVYTLEELLKATLIESNNDSARALASLSGEYDFVKKMNLAASNMMLLDTKLYSSDGTERVIANKYLENTSTPEDVARLIVTLYKNSPELLKITTIPYATVSDVTKIKSFTAYSTNKLLSYFSDGYVLLGAKTGTSDPSRKHLVLLFRDQKGDEYVIVLLQSKDNFADAKILLDGVKEYAK